MWNLGYLHPNESQACDRPRLGNFAPKSASVFTPVHEEGRMRGILYREILNRLPANSTLGTMVDDWFGAAQGFKDELEADGHNETAAAVSDIIEEQRRFQKCATAHAEEG